jgi:hypothetical protein
MEPPQQQSRVLGNYVLQSIIGRGGMSDVFAAEHRFLGDAVAVKVLHARLAEDEVEAKRFLQEATRTRAIVHPNVVRVLDFGRAEDDGAIYLVMERLQGENLRMRLRRTGPLAETEARRIGAAIADGMAAAHELGIIHRDLKPANIMLVDGERPKIVDFGISKRLSAAVSITDGRMGTPAYMTPEQLMGGLVGPFSDVWALGVILFELVTGELPFAPAEAGGYPQLFTAPRPPPVAISAELAGLIASCLARNPAERPASMRVVAERLRGAAAPATERTTQPVTGSRSTTAAAEPARPAPRWRVMAAAFVVAALALAVVVPRLTDVIAPASPEPPALIEPPPPESPALIGSPPVAPPPATRAPAPTATAASAPATDVTPAPKTAPKTTARATGTASQEASAASGPADVFVRSRPPGASIVVDGAAVAVTPGRLSLRLPRRIVVTLPGYRPQALRLHKPGTVEVRLQPEPRPRSPVYHERLD